MQINITVIHFFVVIFVTNSLTLIVHETLSLRCFKDFADSYKGSDLTHTVLVSTSENTFRLKTQNQSPFPPFTLSWIPAQPNYRSVRTQSIDGLSSGDQ